MSSRAQRRNAERRQHNELARSALVVQATPGRAAAKTQLELLAGRGAITLAQKHAGERLYRYFHLSGAEPRITASMQPNFGGTSGRVVERQAESYERYFQGIKAVGDQLAPVLFHVCILDCPAGDWADQAGKPKADGAALLRLALDMLVEHYRAKA